MSHEPERAAARTQRRAQTRVLFVAWLGLCVLALALGVRDPEAPGLYYDEVIQAVPAGEFLAADGEPLQMPGADSARLLGRWLPVFTQPYMGALKSQLLIPVFAVFGVSPASLRLATLAFGLVAIGFAMLLARELLGLPAALLTGALLAVDPSLLFVSRHDWGSFALALLLRCAGLYALVSGHRSGSPTRSFLGGLCLGLGFYNKVDSAAPLAAAALAFALAAPREAAAVLRTRTRGLLIAAAGFALGAAPMLAGLASVLGAAQDLYQASSGAEVRDEKVAALLRTLDGSYFDRLMRAGGSFERMFDGAQAATSPFLALYALAIVGLALWLALPAQRKRPQPAIAFVLAAALLSSLAIFLTPRAVRIHHVLGAYPFPQLVVAAAIVTLAGAGGRHVARAGRSRARQAAAAGVAALALVGGARASLATFDTIERNHGKGRWSDAVSQLAAELAADPRSLAVSFDWGFAARLRFLDRGLAQREPIWRLVRQGARQTPWSFEGDAHVRYLLWERDFAVFPIGPAFLDAVRALDPARVEIRRWLDRDGDPAFVSVRIAGPHQIVYRGMQGARPFEVVLR